MNKKLLEILCCPVSHKRLSLMRRDQLRKINDAIGEGRVTRRDGTVLDAELEDALVTDDGKILYPVDDGIPVLTEEAGVSLEGLSGG